MHDPPKTIWTSLENKGYSRRDFVQLCSYVAGLIGLGSAGLPTVVAAFEKKVRPAVAWLHFQECTCCSESFLRSSHPIVADLVLDLLSLDYTETLQAAAGHQAHKCLTDTMEKHRGEYILLVEGSVPMADGGIYCTIGGKTALAMLEEAAAGAAAVIAWGSCASNGCIQSAKPNPTRATPIHEVLDRPVIRVPGCPPIADVMTGVVAHLLIYGGAPELDSQGRPREFYGRRVHDTCYRRPYYDAGLFVEAFDDENARRGYCLYKMGCRGPVTYNACSVTRWNDSTSYPIQSGHGCIGCSEHGFWDNGPFYRHLAAFPGFGIESTADSIGTAVGVTAVAGVALHAITTNIRKSRAIRGRKERSLTADEHREGEAK